MSPFTPILGCLPMLLPMPILFALYFVFQNTIELRGVHRIAAALQHGLAHLGEGRARLTRVVLAQRLEGFGVVRVVAETAGELLNGLVHSPASLPRDPGA